MKRLSDFKGEEALELWADLLEPLSEIMTDKEIEKVVKSGAPRLKVAQTIIKNHAKEAEQILLRIDPAPIDALNLVLRLVALINDIGQHEDIKSFFGYAAQAKMEKESSGSVTENTEASES